METNYELKHKCLLVPLKVVLLVIAMVMVGFTTYAQQGKSVKVADNQQLINAMQDRTIGTVELGAGYYEYLNYQAEDGAKVVKAKYDNGNREAQCTYWIIGSNVCFDPDPDDPFAPFPGYVYNEARAGYQDDNIPACNCCPVSDNLGTWSVISQPTGSDVIFGETIDQQEIDFYVDMPGAYLLRYTWGNPYNSLVETQYFFYGPVIVDLSADDVCGLTTEVDFVLESAFPDPITVVGWTLNGQEYDGPEETETFDLTVPGCGYYELSVTVDPERCPPETRTIWIDFSCEPYADAGPDINVCDDVCYYSLIGSTGLYTFSPTHAWSWVQLSGPGTLVFDNYDEEVTGVCVDEIECPYGEYEVQFQVQNGQCYDEDEAYLRFYEMPEADAGPDQYLCDEECFSLAAVPFEYCGEEGVNYYKHAWWELVSQPGDCLVTFDKLDPATNVCVSDCDCIYGTYTFEWFELNVKVVGTDTLWSEAHCVASDLVHITLYEEAVVDAGDDAEYCESDIYDDGFHLQVEGAIDAPCNMNMAYTYYWSVVSQPGDCDVEFTPDVVNPWVFISNCDPCQYGEYVFRLTVQNGYYMMPDRDEDFVVVCESYDDVSVWIWEQPLDVDAGDDQLLCNEFAFSLEATGAEYCGDFGVNYNNWYSWVLVSGPDECDVLFSSPTDLYTEVLIENCIGDCAYGEWIFGFTEYNGSDEVYCEAYDEVSVFIFEEPVADAGDDFDACVDIAYTPYCYSMTGYLDYCYSMYGVWTKSCGPGDVVFDDTEDPMTGICINEPGHYIFTWTVWNAAEDCEDSDDVVFNVLEEPYAWGEYGELQAECDELCIDLGLAMIDKYEYFGTDEGECPNYWDLSHWSVVMGPDGTDPLQVVFADDTDPETDMCVSWYGAYTVRWNEVNKAVDSDFQCDSFFDVFVEFYETPQPFAGDDDVVCGNCYTLMGELYEYLPPPNQHLSDSFFWEVLDGGNCPVYISDVNSLTPQVCIDDITECYGTYGFVLHEYNGDYCYGTDTVYICFSDVPDDVAVCFYNNPNDCGPWGYGNGSMEPNFIFNGCLQPNEVLEVCADGCTDIQLNPWCGECLPGFDWYNPAFYGWTFEWSLISPAGTVYDVQSGYYDWEYEQWVYPWINICWGECCDTARLYLTITTDEGECGVACENTMEYKFYVHHKPCAEIVGPDVSEVGALTGYCNVCPEEFDQSCLLYTWTAEHCGEIVSGQGTDCIEVLWTDYNVNGGWGEITLTVLDTCTGCCNYDEMMVKIWPEGTLGEDMLAGHVFYHNNGETPLNGVEVQLWNGGIPVMSTMSFNDIEGGNGVGYYEFPGINGITEFGVTASYDAPWFGANATDALAVELKVIDNLPGSFVYDDVVEQAMDVNANSDISATDALWIKQRAINMVNYFPAGNWVFDPAMAADASATPYDIYTLNAGDANRSNIPNSGKSAPAVDLISDGMMNVVTGEVFELPIRLADAAQFGAITLNLEFNSSLIDVVEVVSMDGMLDNITNGNVSIAWSNLNPMALTENDVVVTLKVKALGEIASTASIFSIGYGSEFADQSANVIEPVTLKTFGITTEPAAADYFLSTNRPNPFSTSTFIEYTMPETGKVTLSVLDMLGQEIAVLVNATQTAGSYTVEFSAAGLATGVYIYKITVDGETRDFISTQRMVISH